MPKGRITIMYVQVRESLMTKFIFGRVDRVDLWERGFHAEERARAKALRWECAWCNMETQR